MTRLVFFACLTCSVVLMIAGFIVPPRGVIDGSVLTAVGELFAFATLASVIKMSRYKQMELKHGNTTLTIGEDEGAENKET